MAFGHDESNPLDTSTINSFPANERAMRLSKKDMWEIEHDTASGHHKILDGSKATRDAISDWVDGSLWLRTGSVNPGIDAMVSSTYQQIATLIKPGVKAVFYQNSAPDGWTFSGVTDDCLLLNKNPVTGGGSAAAGDWTFAGVTVAGHQLSIAETPLHTHDQDGETGAGTTGSGFVEGDGVSPKAVTSTSSGNGPPGDAHVHPSLVHGGWRPKNVGVIICTKDAD